MKRSTADYVMLGFLSAGAMSGYDVSRRMAATTSHFYRTSFGSIYPSLAKMEAEGLVASDRDDTEGRARKAYRILGPGRKALREWLASPLDIAAGPSLLLARIFFLGALEPDRARSALADYRKAAAERRDWLEGALEAAIVELGDSRAEPDLFQAATRGFGLEYYEFAEKWLGRLEEAAAKRAKKAAARSRGAKGES